MNEESLFSEEAEPPSISNSSMGVENSGTIFFPTSHTKFHPAYRLRQATNEPVALRENPVSRNFRKRFFPTTKYQSWNDWHWQLQNRITDAVKLAEMIPLTSVERIAVEHGKSLPLAITPYYTSLFSTDNASQPLRRTVIPSLEEGIISVGEQEDPLEEERDTPVPGIVHRYPDRVLFLVTDYCSTYCRYCTRSRMVGWQQPAPL